MRNLFLFMREIYEFSRLNYFSYHKINNFGVTLEAEHAFSCNKFRARNLPFARFIFYERELAESSH